MKLIITTLALLLLPWSVRGQVGQTLVTNDTCSYVSYKVLDTTCISYGRYLVRTARTSERCWGGEIMVDTIRDTIKWIPGFPKEKHTYAEIFGGVLIRI